MGVRRGRLWPLRFFAKVGGAVPPFSFSVERRPCDSRRQTAVSGPLTSSRCVDDASGIAFPALLVSETVTAPWLGPSQQPPLSVEPSDGR